jgi:hypothetical protein
MSSAAVLIVLVLIVPCNRGMGLRVHARHASPADTVSVEEVRRFMAYFEVHDFTTRVVDRSG